MATYAKEMIIRYAEGELDAADRQQFEAALRENPALRAELDLYLELKTELAQRLAPDPNKAALEERLHSLNKEYFAGRPLGLTIMMSRWFIGVAAASILVVVSLMVLLTADRTGLVDRLGQTAMIGTTDRGDQSDTLFATAAGYFNRQQFSKALPLLDSAMAKDSSSQLARFYHGVASLHVGAVTNARTDLERVYNSESLLRYDAAFFLALSYAAEKNKPLALEWLDRIPAGSPVDSKVKQLRDGLK